MSDTRDVDRLAVLALIWQVSNVIERNPGKYNALPQLLEQFSDLVRNLPGISEEKEDLILLQDVLDAAATLRGFEDDDGINMVLTTFVIYDPRDVEKWPLTMETWQYYVNISREADGCWNP